MKRVAFKMYLKQGCKEEYRKRHRELWPEVADLLREAGIRDYSIFLDERTHVLYALQSLEGEAGSQELGQHPVIRKWWNHMADIMEVNPDKSPVTEPLEEMFYLP